MQPCMKALADLISCVILHFLSQNITIKLHMRLFCICVKEIPEKPVNIGDHYDNTQSSLDVCASWTSTPPKASTSLLPYSIPNTFPPHNPTTAQAIPKVSTIKCPGTVLKVRLSAEDNFVSAANRARGFLHKTILRATNSNMFLPGIRLLSGHILNMPFKHRLLSYPATHRHQKRCCERPLPCLVRSSSPTAVSILSKSLTDPWRSKLNVQYRLQHACKRLQESSFDSSNLHAYANSAKRIHSCAIKYCGVACDAL